MESGMGASRCDVVPLIEYPAGEARAAPERCNSPAAGEEHDGDQGLAVHERRWVLACLQAGLQLSRPL